MSREYDFSETKVGATILIERDGRYSRMNRDFYKATVTHRTKTRFTAKSEALGAEFTFTNDGEQYPRQSGYGRVYTKPHPFNDDTALQYQKSRSIRSIFAHINALDDLSRKDSVRQIDQATPLTLAHVADALEKAYRLLKKLQEEGTE